MRAPRSFAREVAKSRAFAASVEKSVATRIVRIELIVGSLASKRYAASVPDPEYAALR
jgi:hypothetical protein